MVAEKTIKVLDAREAGMGWKANRITLEDGATRVVHDSSALRQRRMQP
jgi:hypothetical protein